MPVTKKNKEPIKLARINSIQDVYDLGGGIMQIAADLKVHSRTVERFRKVGINPKYYDKLSDLYGCTPIELFNLTRKIQGA